MAKKSKLTAVKKVAIIGGILIVLQLGYIFTQKGEPPKTIRQAINDRLSKMNNLPPERRDQLKVQLALNDYMSSNRGNPPSDLKVLIPKYFDTLPLDPSTNKPFEYKVEGRRYRLGTGVSAVAMQDSKGDNKSTGKDSDPEKVKADEQADLIAMLDLQGTRERFVYDPSAKRDPFKPFDVAPDLDYSDDKPPLERYPLTRWRMTAVLDAFGEPAAIVESESGRGHTVKIGTKIGTHGGKVIDIEADRIIVLEEEVDFTGEKKTRRIEIPMTAG